MNCIIHESKLCIHVAIGEVENIPVGHLIADDVVDHIVHLCVVQEFKGSDVCSTILEG